MRSPCTAPDCAPPGCRLSCTAVLPCTCRTAQLPCSALFRATVRFARLCCGPAAHAVCCSAGSSSPRRVLDTARRVHVQGAARGLTPLVELELSRVRSRNGDCVSTTHRLDPYSIMHAPSFVRVNGTSRQELPRVHKHPHTNTRTHACTHPHLHMHTHAHCSLGSSYGFGIAGRVHASGFCGFKATTQSSRTDQGPCRANNLRDRHWPAKRAHALLLLLGGPRCLASEVASHNMTATLIAKQQLIRRCVLTGLQGPRDARS